MSPEKWCRKLAGSCFVSGHGGTLQAFIILGGTTRATMMMTMMMIVAMMAVMMMHPASEDGGSNSASCLRLSVASLPHV